MLSELRNECDPAIEQTGDYVKRKKAATTRT